MNTHNTPSALEVLQVARRGLAERGWVAPVRGSHGPSYADWFAGRLSIRPALEISANLLADGDVTAQRQGSCDAAEMLCAVADLDFAYPHESLAEWERAEGRTPADVLRLMRRASALLRRLEGVNPAEASEPFKRPLDDDLKTFTLLTELQYANCLSVYPAHALYRMLHLVARLYSEASKADTDD